MIVAHSFRGCTKYHVAVFIIGSGAKNEVKPPPPKKQKTDEANNSESQGEVKLVSLAEALIDLFVGHCDLDIQRHIAIRIHSG